MGETEKEREHTRIQVGEEQRERERENPKLAPAVSAKCNVGPDPTTIRS